MRCSASTVFISLGASRDDKRAKLEGNRIDTPASRITIIARDDVTDDPSENETGHRSAGVTGDGTRGEADQPQVITRGAILAAHDSS